MNAVTVDDQGSSLLEAARTLAGELLEPRAAEVDATVVPRSHLAALGDAGLLGVMAPAAEGGSAASPALVRQIQAVLAGADAATWFVSVQHHGPVRTLADSSAPVREDLLRQLATGKKVAGTAFAHLRSWPDRPMRADRVEGGFRFSGVAPWYTGWGLNDVCSLGGATVDGEIVFGLVEARTQPGLMASEPMRMAAMTATQTVRLEVDGLLVPDSHVVLRQPVEQWLRLDRRQTVNPNPAVFGVTAAALRQLREVGEQGGLAPAESAAERLNERMAETYAATERLLEDVDPDDAHDERLAVRADAQQIMMDATTALVVAGGGRSLTASAPAQRLLREAAFLLVQAQTRPAREVLLGRWAKKT